MLLKRAKDFALAIWSLARYGDATLTDYKKRRDICRECLEMVATATGFFCNACGCPKWPLADLRTKWRMRDLKCPLEKW